MSANDLLLMHDQEPVHLLLKHCNAQLNARLQRTYMSYSRSLAALSQRSTKPSTSVAAVLSARLARPRNVSRTRLWPLVEGPGAQRSAWRHWLSSRSPHRAHIDDPGARSAPRRKRTASTNSAGDRIVLSGADSTHNHRWSVLLSHKSFHALMPSQSCA